MKALNIDKAKEQFCELVDTIEAGEEIILEKSGEPFAKIIPIQKRGKRVLGKERGKIWMSEDFTAPLGNFTILTNDEKIKEYPIYTIW